MDEAKLAQTALAFLQRAQLQGGEVSTFVAVAQWLEAKAQPQPEQPEKEEG